MTASDEGRTWRIKLPYVRPPLNLNQRLHWRAAKRIKDQLRSDVLFSLRAAKIPPLGRVSVHLEWTVPDARRRDSDNPAPTLKVCSDALVDAKIVVDDNTEYVAHDRTIITYEKGKSEVHLVVTEQEE